MSSPADGRIKMYVMATALRARRADADLYLRGDYVPLAVTGARAAHVFAFARTLDGRSAVVIVPRLTVTLLSDPFTAPVGRDLWRDTRVLLPERIDRPGWSNVFTGVPVVAEGGLRVGKALERFPVALLTSVG